MKRISKTKRRHLLNILSIAAHRAGWTHFVIPLGTPGNLHIAGDSVSDDKNRPWSPRLEAAMQGSMADMALNQAEILAAAMEDGRQVWSGHRVALGGLEGDRLVCLTCGSAADRKAGTVTGHQICPGWKRSMGDDL